jgi:hypothetical protein
MSQGGPHNRIGCSVGVRVRCGIAGVVGEPAGTGAQPDWVTALRGGGYVIVMHHGATHEDRADTNPLNLANAVKQRQLNDAGRAKAREIGAAIKKLGIPIGQVIASRYFCAIETGRPAFGEPRPAADVTEGRQVAAPAA